MDFFQFTVLRKEGQAVVVGTDYSDGLAVTQLLDDPEPYTSEKSEWLVTHVPSGHRIGRHYFTSIAAASKAKAAVLSLARWQDLDPVEGLSLEEKRELIRAIMAAEKKAGGKKIR